MAIDTGGRRNEPLDFDELLDELERKVERLKILYEQYFMGIEKLEPQTARKEVSRKLLELAQQNLRNTSIRYRFNSLNQKFSVYTTYWNRTLRAIENGTYMRSVARAGREAARRGLDMPDEVLRALPPLLRDRLLKDREKVVSRAAEDAKRRRGGNPATEPGAGETLRPSGDAPTGARPDPAPPPQGAEAEVEARTEAPGEAQPQPPRSRAAAPSPRPPKLFDGDVEDEFDNLFGQMTGETAPVGPLAKEPAAPRPETRPPPGANPVAPPPVKPAVAVTPRPQTERSVPPASGAPVATQRPRPAPVLPPGVAEPEAKELFRRYVMAKKLLGEDTSGLRYEQIVSVIAKQAPGVMERHKAKGVDFSIVIKDDKVLLKATPKK